MECGGLSRNSENGSEEYTADVLNAMTVSQIRALASELGYGITKTLKADIINQFLAEQEARNA